MLDIHLYVTIYANWLYKTSNISSYYFRCLYFVVFSTKHNMSKNDLNSSKISLSYSF